MNEEYSPEEYAQYRISKAKETLAEVDVLIENEFWNTSINRMYYACFYAVGALLVRNGIETTSHSGTRQKFGQLFVKTGMIEKSLAKHYADLFEKRHKSDYNDFFDYDEEVVLRLLPLSRKFIEAVEGLLNQ
ncbi:HEPN domain-containing protein [Parabacteroides sp. FAFU027]|uniref:HEPN domain-containing protein n=1 Tax=Parabacteroides sp. FAFU027 TaxID=2922715 RepID=UPI001FAF3EB6|nr:HEPN domain-containing protein [Parabacteroides sp. FAFU027]